MPKEYKFHVFMLTFLSVLTSLFGNGCEILSFSSQDRTLSETWNDTSIRLRIIQDLLLHDSGKLDGVEVLVYQGKVLLVGTVSSAQLKKEAKKIVQNVSEVKSVSNELQIGEESFSDYLSDSFTEKKIKTDLMLDGEIKIENYTIRVFKGVLYVLGSASSSAELKRLKYRMDQISLRDAKYFVDIQPLTDASK